jgi:phospholipid/cholesterol/gamma-HCH transport system ATP-binding protein
MKMNSESEPENKVVAIRNLSKSFGGRAVLKNLTVDLFEGENLVVIGRSGAGKSVLIKCLVGLIEPDEGTINVLGLEVTTLSAKELHNLRLQVGFSFQGSALYDSMTVRENLEFPLKRNLGITDPKKLSVLIEDSLEDVGLSHTVNQFPAELSGGMKKRIGIARTLILKPKIMLYDEPTSGLDPITSQEINELIIKMRDKYNTSSIIITHDISNAKATGDRIVALIDGSIRMEGTFDYVKNTNDPELAPFFNY